MADDRDGASLRRDGARRREIGEVRVDHRPDRRLRERVGVAADGRRLEHLERSGDVRVLRGRVVRLRVGGEGPRKRQASKAPSGHRARVGDESPGGERAEIRCVRELAPRAERRRPLHPVFGHQLQREFDERPALGLAERRHRHVVTVAASRPVRRGARDQTGGADEVGPHVQMQRDLVANGGAGFGPSGHRLGACGADL